LTLRLYRPLAPFGERDRVRGNSAETPLPEHYALLFVSYAPLAAVPGIGVAAFAPLQSRLTPSHFNTVEPMNIEE